MNKYILIIIFTLLLPTFSYAQNELDSLKKILEKYNTEKREDTTVINILKKLYDKTQFSKPIIATEYLAEALQIAQKTQDSIQIADMYYTLANDYFKRKVYYLAMDYYSKAKAIFNSHNKSNKIAYSYIGIGNSYFEQGNIEFSSDYYDKAYNIFSSINDQIGLSFVLDKKGIVYMMNDLEDSALIQFNKSLLIRKEKYRLDLVAESHKLIARIYINVEETEHAISNLREALIGYKIKKNETSVAESYLMLGDVYFEDEDYVNARINYNKALIINQDLERKSKIAQLFNKIAAIYFELENYRKTIEFANKSLSISNMSSKNLENKKESYFFLSKSFENRSNIKLAFNSLVRFSEIKDSIAKSKENTQYSEMITSLKIQKQQNQIEILLKDQRINEAELGKAKTRTYGLFIGIGLILIFALYYYRNSMIRKKDNRILKSKNEEINIQKEEIMAQKEYLSSANQTLEKQKEEITKTNIQIHRINKNITGSINYASRIQSAMLPKIEQLKISIPDSFLFFRPKEIVSGDFYWFTELKNQNKIIVAAIDCTGHGVPGAFMSMIGNTYLNQIVHTQKIYEADKILNELNKDIRVSLNQDHTDSRDGMDMALCVIDKEKKQLEFAGAKNPLVYIQDNTMFQIKGDIMAIGGSKKVHKKLFSKHIINIDKPTYLYIFSDGFQDQFGGRYKQKFMRKRFRNLLFDNHKQPFEIQKMIINETLDKWIDDANRFQKMTEQIDDILVIGMKLGDEN